MPKKRKELHGKGHHVYKPLNTNGSDFNDDPPTFLVCPPGTGLSSEYAMPPHKKLVGCCYSKTH